MTSSSSAVEKDWDRFFGREAEVPDVIVTPYAKVEEFANGPVGKRLLPLLIASIEAPYPGRHVQEIFDPLQKSLKIVQENLSAFKEDGASFEALMMIALSWENADKKFSSWWSWYEENHKNDVPLSSQEESDDLLMCVHKHQNEIQTEEKKTPAELAVMLKQNPYLLAKLLNIFLSSLRRVGEEALMGLHRKDMQKPIEYHWVPIAKVVLAAEPKPSIAREDDAAIVSLYGDDPEEEEQPPLAEEEEEKRKEEKTRKQNLIRALMAEPGGPLQLAVPSVTSDEPATMQARVLSIAPAAAVALDVPRLR